MCPLTGDLLEEPASFASPVQLPDKLVCALASCDSPYKLVQPSVHGGTYHGADVEVLRRISSRVIKLSAANFFLARLYAGVRRPIFGSAAHAVEFFRSAMPGPQQRGLCLPRALFAAKTSRAFTTSGVIIFGAFLPSRLMHAWVIEAGCQPDARDDIWTQYRPVAALV